MNLIKITSFAALVGTACFMPLTSSAHRVPVRERPRMEVVFVLDTTGSMGGMIAGAKQKIWAIANKLKSARPTPEISFGLVGYRDRGDDYVTRVHGLSTNLDEVYRNLQSFQALGGNDEPESVNEALHKAVRDMQWSSDPRVMRVIFLVGDARPHMDYQDDVKYSETCRLANKKGILINTLQCGRLSGTETVWREIASKTNGTYGAILQDGGTVRIDTPFDEQIREINLRLNSTIILYGSRAEQANAAGNKAAVDTLSAEAMADRASYFGKAAASEPGAVVTGGGDLVADIISGREKAGEIDEKKLDPKLQKMPAPAREALIAKKVEERQRLQTELNDLVAKRDADVSRQMKELEGTEGALELNAFETLEQQAAAKGYEFEESP